MVCQLVLWQQGSGVLFARHGALLFPYDMFLWRRAAQLWREGGSSVRGEQHPLPMEVHAHWDVSWRSLNPPR